MTQINDHLVLLVGKATSGKTTALRNIKNPSGVMYLNCENGKRPPFKEAKEFKSYTITDPQQVYEAFDFAEKKPEIHTIIVDSLTFLMDMYESQIVLKATNTMKAWGDYQQYLKNLMQVYVARSSKKVIFTAHVKDELNETEMVRETSVPVKGALKNNGVESFFNIIVATKKVKVKDLENYHSELLTITDKERELGFKHCIQTQLTKDTVNEKLRSPMGLFEDNETFINGDIQLVLNRLDEYYD